MTTKIHWSDPEAVLVSHCVHQGVPIYWQMLTAELLGFPSRTRPSHQRKRQDMQRRPRRAPTEAMVATLAEVTKRELADSIGDDHYGLEGAIAAAIWLGHWTYEKGYGELARPDGHTAIARANLAMGWTRAPEQAPAHVRARAVVAAASVDWWLRLRVMGVAGSAGPMQLAPPTSGAFRYQDDPRAVRDLGSPRGIRTELAYSATGNGAAACEAW